MSRDLSVAWELLTAVTRVHRQLAAARPQIWERFRLPTAEHTSIMSVPSEPDQLGHTDPAGDHVAVRVSLDTHLPDGRLLSSCLDITVGPRRWRTQPYIALSGGAAHTFLWEGQAVERDDTTGFIEMIDSVTQSLLQATLGLDFGAIVTG